MTDYEKIFNEQLSKYDNKELNMSLTDAQKREIEIWAKILKNPKKVTYVLPILKTAVKGT